jgi:hypothetical protein
MTAASGTAWRWLHATWWAILPGFAWVVFAMTAAEMCSQRGPWLATLTSRPETALPLAVLYAAGHAWFVAAVLFTTAHTGELLPSVGAVRDSWRGSLRKPGAIAAFVVVAYTPLTLVRAAGEIFGCRP